MFVLRILIQNNSFCKITHKKIPSIMIWTNLLLNNKPQRRENWPVRTVNLVPRMRDLPLAKKVCVWCNVAYGMIVREEWFSKSAEMAIDSPGNTQQGWGLLNQFPPFRYFPNFSSLSKHTLTVKYHVYIWQVSPQLSCADTCQILMWFKESNMYFCKIENFAYGEINEL